MATEKTDHDFDIESPRYFGGVQLDMEKKQKQMGTNHEKKETHSKVCIIKGFNWGG